MSSSRSPSVEYDPSVEAIEDLLSGVTSSEFETTEEEDDDDDMEVPEEVVERLLELAGEADEDDDDEYEGDQTPVR